VVLINVAQREISCKIVYYGPGLCGKTTNIQVVHDRTPQDNKGRLTSLATEGDRTLFFDFLPLDLGTIGGMRTKFQLYTVPGQVFYNATRKLVLRGADGVIFVADSNPDKMKENIESVGNLIANLKEQGMDITEVPLVFQWNKRDLPNATPVEELQKALNRWNAPAFDAVAIKGEGIFATLKCVSGLVLEKISRKAPQRVAAKAPEPPPAPKPAPAAPSPAPSPAMGRPSVVTPAPGTPSPPPKPPVVQPPATPPARPSAAPVRVAAAAAAPKAPRAPEVRRPAASPPAAATPPRAGAPGVSPARPAIKPLAPAAPVMARSVTPKYRAATPAPEPAPFSRFVKKDKGISWGIFALVVALLIGAILFICFAV
jgi:hypothetical protein